ncbi:hypothetical protein [Streptomyces sp. NPDC002685]|uniref:hypothetical protein n=1 Tax=Streptomyces sp. NPDC002685 TaxID=3154540 RepID=UPI003322460E
MPARWRVVLGRQPGGVEAEGVKHRGEQVRLQRGHGDALPGGVLPSAYFPSAQT